MSKVIGIDLGTTNSCVAIVENRRPVVISNKGGYKTTPSVVAFLENKERLVGQPAKRQAVTNPTRTIAAFKRLIGRKWESPEVKRTMETASYKIVEGPHHDPRIDVEGKVFSIPEVSAMVLLEMKRVAEDFLDSEVQQVVITVPAYFNDNQRQATKDAGAIAGLDVLRIINEPTAAALAYGFGKEDEKRVAIYDLGGGTFDISILEISHGVFEVICTAGDTFLGGEDFDAAIIDHVAEEFSNQNGVDLRKDKIALQRLKEAAEKAKCELSDMDQTEISLPFIHSDSSGAKHLRTVLTRAHFEGLIAILVDKTIETCQKTLELADLKPSDIDELILVGGSTRIPLVQKKVQEFYGREPSKNVHPDEVVALGAAVQGAALTQDYTDALLLDVTPHALGIITKGGLFTTLIEKNTTVPTQKSHIFTTVQDNQKAVKIKVFQGESRKALENEMLGEFILDGIAAASAGKPEIEVSFAIDSDGIVNVSARDLQTGKSQSITVTATSGLSKEEIKQVAEDYRDYEIKEREKEGVLQDKHELSQLVQEVEMLMQKKSVGADSPLHAKISMVIRDVREAMGGQKQGDLALFRASLKKFLDDLNNL